MATEQRLGANFTINTTDLKAGLTQANRLIRESESEFKAAAAGMDDWRKSADGLTARNSHLSNTIDLQKKKVEALQKEYDRLVAGGMNPASKEAVELRTKINNETTALNKNEKELKDNAKALEDLEESSKDASKSTKDLNDNTNKAGKGLSGLGKAAGIGAVAIAAVAAAAIAAFKALLNLAESTRELRTEMGRLETGFTNAGLSADDATKTYNDLYAVLGDTGKASEAASHLALLANNSEDLAKWTDICTGVYATFGDSLPIEGLTEAANETAKTGQLTGVLADALNWAGVSEDDFQKKLDACNSEQERQALITETLSGLYDDQADKYKEVNKEIIAANEATNNLAQAQAELGEAIEPLNTAITNLKTKLLTELTPALKEIIDILGDVFNGVEGSPERLANSVSSLFSSVLEKVTEMLPKLAEFATQLIVMLAETIIEQLPQIAEAAVQIIATIIDTIGDMLPSLIPIIVDSVLLMAETLIDNIDLIIDAAIKLMEGLAEGLVEAIPMIISKIPVIIDKLIQAIIKNIPKIFQAGEKIILGLADGLVNAIPDLVKSIPQIISSLVNALLEGIPQLIEAGAQLAWGLLQGLGDALWRGIQDLGNMVVDFFKGIFGIHSPSKVFEEEIGTYLGQGMALGLEEGFNKNIKDVNNNIVRSLDDLNPELNINATSSGKGRNNSSGVVINQYNTYSKAHSRYELFKTKQQTAAAVRLAVGGSNA